MWYTDNALQEAAEAKEEKSIEEKIFETVEIVESNTEPEIKVEEDDEKSS